MPSKRAPATAPSREAPGPGAPDAPARPEDSDAARGAREPDEPDDAPEEDAEDDAPPPVLEGEVLGPELDDEVEESGGDGPYLPLAERGGVLVRGDPLSRYIAEVNRFERLSAADEHALAVAWQQDRDEEAARRLVTSHLRLVVSIALSFRRAFANVLDLIQEGNVGLMEAVARFDPLKGTRLSTYATWWIRSRIVRHLLDNWRLVRVGTTNVRRKLLYNLRAEKERLTGMGITPTPKLLADNLGATPEDVVAVDQALGASDVSLDVPLGESGGTTGGELLPGGFDSPEDEVARRLLVERLHAVLAELEPRLSPRETALLHERLLAEEPVTLQELAHREGVSREALRQSEQRLLGRLRDWLAEHFPEASELQLGRGSRRET